ncbi:hypothetical protein PUN4_60106 [Paraburkholderia unamae]|uniref:hypothetical protein n=1 Tax=Paraburkholderia unamae TaxID=219649 RepID=UPI000DD3C425|nr:hypothetical protein [Paraburkholderia unamae]CAG9269891.1 hypothetical protein PUN4_60106 [Paraburkholderia unamae]
MKQGSKDDFNRAAQGAAGDTPAAEPASPRSGPATEREALHKMIVHFDAQGSSGPWRLEPDSDRNLPPDASADWRPAD